MADDAGEFNPFFLLAVLAACFANEYFSVLTLFS